jgi:hypothetical protein
MILVGEDHPKITPITQIAAQQLVLTRTRLQESA